MPTEAASHRFGVKYHLQSHAFTFVRNTPSAQISVLTFGDMEGSPGQVLEQFCQPATVVSSLPLATLLPCSAVSSPLWMEAGVSVRSAFICSRFFTSESATPCRWRESAGNLWVEVTVQSVVWLIWCWWVGWLHARGAVRVRGGTRALSVGK